MAVMPHPSRQGRAPPSSKLTPSGALSFHPHSAHYLSFAPDSQPILDFHTKRRDHTGLEPGTLDSEGILAHTDFIIDPSRCDVENEEHFQEYLARRKQFEAQLKILYEKTPKLPVKPLHNNITYVRPFLSSTFKDFNAERNLLVAQSFPRLEKLCNERNLFFAPLDLRWGVTSEQSGNGQVINMCLQEIDRSRPYFVGSLGFRNGWALMPHDDPSDQYVQLLEKTFEMAEETFPWIQKCHDRSVTELEILHGALNDPNLSPRSFFYFRDVEFLEKLPKEQRKWFIETGEAEKRLQQLKTRIVAAGFSVRYFHTPQQMADLLEEDLKGSIERDFPIQKLTPLDREVKDHQAFAEVRTRIYVGGQEHIEKLDRFLADESPDHPQVCVITGASGAGKSSLIANWIKQVKQRAKHNRFKGKKHEGEQGSKGGGGGAGQGSKSGSGVGTTGGGGGSVGESLALLSPPRRTHSHKPAASADTGAATFHHQQQQQQHHVDSSPDSFHWNCSLIQDRYIGSTSDSTQPGPLLRWILTEIKDRFQYIEREVPQDPKQVVEEFPEFLEVASSQASPILLVLDGLDQLDDQMEDAHHLLWLPKELPKAVKVVVSTIQGSLTHKALLERAAANPSKHQFLSIDNVSDAHCLQLIRTFLGSYGKNLDAEQEQRIMACERTRNPLYLITFLQEVRSFGSFESLNDRISHYMDANSVSEMFLKVIQRLEEDFETPEVPLVRMTLSLMMLSRRGLNEVELKGALELALGVSAQKGTFPNIEFSALMLRLDQQLVDQRGLRKFSHNYLKTAVETKYFTRPPRGASREEKRKYTSQAFIRKILADYFCSIPLSERKVEEAPWHLWMILHESVEHSTHDGDNEEEEEDFNKLEEQDASEMDEEDLDAEDHTSPSSLAHAHATTTTTGSALQTRSRKLDLGAIQKSLTDLICHLDMFERLRGDNVYDLHKYWLLLEGIKGLANAQSGKNQSTTLSYAAACYSSALKKWSILDPKPTPLEFAEKAESIATFLIGTDRYTGSEIFLDQALEIRSQVQGPLHPEVELILSKKANLFYRQGRYEEALPLYQQALSIVEKHEQNNSTASVRSSVLRTSIAGLLKEQGKFEESQPLYEKSLQDKVALLGPKHPVVAVSMSNLAELHLRLHKPEKALPLYQQSLQIMEHERGRSHPEVATIVSSLASCYMQLEKFEEAIKLYERARKIKEDLLGSNHVSVAVVLNNLAATYQKQGEPGKALKLLERSLKIRQAVHGADSPLLAQTLQNMGDVYLEEKKYRHAESYFQQSLDIMEKDKGKLHVDLMGTLTSLAKLHFDLEEFDEALLIYFRQLEIMESHYGGVDERVQQSLNNIGMVYQSMEQYERALPFHLRELFIARTRAGPTSLRVSDVLMILGVLLVSMDRPLQGLQVFKRCYLIRRSVLGVDHDQTREPLGWIHDLSEDDEEDTEVELADMTLEQVEEPEEINEEAQLAAVPMAVAPPSVSSSSPRLPNLRPAITITHPAGAPSRSTLSLPPIGGVQPRGGSFSVPSASANSLPPIQGHRPSPSGPLPSMASGTGSSAAASSPLTIRLGTGGQGNNSLSPANSSSNGLLGVPQLEERKKRPSIVFT